jgi:hypothetical protein
MAKIYAAPKEIEYKADWSEDWRKNDNEYIAKLREHCRKFDNDPLVGEIIKTPRADGYAQYMVGSVKPFFLILLPLGDAWRADAIWERGIRLAEARKMVKNEKEFAKLWADAKKG